jgi:hypothetical protein
MDAYVMTVVRPTKDGESAKVPVKVEVTDRFTLVGADKVSFVRLHIGDHVGGPTYEVDLSPSQTRQLAHLLLSFAEAATPWKP